MPGTRGLLIAAILLAALAGGVWYSNKLEKEKEGKPPEDSSAKLLDIPEDQFAMIEITKAGVTPVTLIRDGTDWKMVTPESLAVDRDAATSIVSTLSSYSTDRLVEENATDLKPFGLDAPSLAVSVKKKDGSTEKLLIGSETPTGGGFFAKKDGDPRVFTIYSYNRSSLDKTWKDLRDRRMLPFGIKDVSRVELAKGGQVIEIGKTAGGDWQILKPGPYRADNVVVDEVVRKLNDAKMDLSVSDSEAAQAAALWSKGTPAVVARVYDASGGKQIQIRKNGDKYFARSDTVEGAFRLESGIEGVDKTLDELRNKKLFDFGFTDPVKIAVLDEGSATELTRIEQDWQSSGKKMDSSSVSQLIDKIRDLRALKFLDSGFTAPTLTVEASTESGRPEKVLIAKSGFRWIAKRDGEPALYELDGKDVEELQQAVKDLKEASSSPEKK
jgi:hypothetical protein